MAEIDVVPADEFPPGSMEGFVSVGPRTISVYNLFGKLYAIEDRCSHDDGPLRGRLGSGDVHGRLPAARLRVRAADRAAAVVAGVPSRWNIVPVQIVDGVVRVDVG